MAQMSGVGAAVDKVCKGEEIRPIELGPGSLVARREDLGGASEAHAVALVLKFESVGRRVLLGDVGDIGAL